MWTGHDRISRAGGIAFLASGLLFLTISVLHLAMGPPPPGGSVMLAWVMAQEPLLGAVVEVLFFAVVALIPAVVALYRKLGPSHPTSAVVACGTIAMTIPLLAVLVTVLGRLVFPVFHLRAHTVETSELILALYFGGVHAAMLLFAGSTFVISLALRQTAPGLAHLGFATSVADVIAGYPDTVGPVVTFLCGGLFAAWLTGMGRWVASR
jgi:hypothetical protein